MSVPSTMGQTFRKAPPKVWIFQSTGLTATARFLTTTSSGPGVGISALSTCRCVNYMFILVFVRVRLFHPQLCSFTIEPSGLVAFAAQQDVFDNFLDFRHLVP